MRDRRQLLSFVVAITALCALPDAARAAGLLLPRGGGAPLELKYHRVEIEARDGTAVTRVEQVFKNNTGRDMEATFLFPLPSDAVIVDFKLLVNGKMKKGEVLPREKAKAIYEQIVAQMRDPGLVEWMGGNLFQARIYPVPAHGEQKVELAWTQVLPYLNGTYKLTHPLKTPAPVTRTMEDFTLTARLSHKTPLRAIYSPTHRISVARKGEHEATIGFERERAALDDNFVLYFGVSDEDVGLQVLTHRPPGEPGYFMVLASPRAVFKDGERPQKIITFVLDTSGSMAGSKIEDARRALLWSLEQLGPDDRFNVVRFSSDVEALSDSYLQADAKHVAEARKFVQSFEAAGGTAIDEALEVALGTRLDGDETSSDPRLVMFITDGRPTVGETSRDKILERSRRFNTQQTRLFAFGVGDEVDALMLDRLAAENGGSSAYVTAGEDLDVQISALYNQLSHPVLSDITLDVRNVSAYAVLPRRMSQLFKGQQIVQVGRFRKAADALIRLQGTMGGRERTWDFETGFPERRTDDSFIASIWADRQVGFLLDQIRQHGESAELKGEVVQLATRFGIVTPYTSYLVTEDTPQPALVPRDPRPSPRPRPLMQGADRGGMSGSGRRLDGEMAPREAEEALQDAFGGQRRAAGSPSAAPPATATRAPRKEVAEAKALKHYQAKKTAESDSRAIKRAGGRAFHWTGGAWVDTSYTAGMTTIRVEAYSDAWWRVLALKPELRSALALGEQVVVRSGAVAVIVEPGGLERLGAAEERLLSK